MAEEKAPAVPTAEGEKMRPAEVIMSMLTYGSKEDWELGMEKMKRRPFLEEDMEKVLKVISAEANPTEGKVSEARADLAKWSQGLATTVTKVKKLAEEKQTSLYQATELLKISCPAFEFVCHTLKRSFTVSDTCVQRLEAFDDQFKKMIEQRKSDDPEDTQDSQLQECLKTLQSAIEVAERDRAAFGEWKGKDSKAVSSTDSVQEMEEIVGSEKTELDVIKNYCEKDVKKIHDGVAKLKEELKERNAERDGEIAKLDRELTVNRDRQAALERELLQLREEERGLTGGIKKLRSEQSRAVEEAKQSEQAVARTQQDIEQLLAKTETSLTIIAEMGDVARNILDRADREQAKLEQDTASWNLATLRQLRRAVLVEMTVRQQHIDNRNQIIRDCETRLGELDKELKEAKKKNFRARIGDINRQRDTYTHEKDEATNEVGTFEARQRELRAKLNEVDASLRALDPSAALSSFEELYKAFEAKYDKAFEDGCKGISFVAEDA